MIQMREGEATTTLYELVRLSYLSYYVFLWSVSAAPSQILSAENSRKEPCFTLTCKVWCCRYFSESETASYRLPISRYKRRCAAAATPPACIAQRFKRYRRKTQPRSKSRSAALGKHVNCLCWKLRQNFQGGSFSDELISRRLSRHVLAW